MMWLNYQYSSFAKKKLNFKDSFTKFSKRCEKLKAVDIFEKNWKKNEVYLKNYENIQKNKKFEGLFALIMKICRKILKVKV